VLDLYLHFRLACFQHVGNVSFQLVILLDETPIIVFEDHDLRSWRGEELHLLFSETVKLHYLSEHPLELE
jgi:hypothetical protein